MKSLFQRPLNLLRHRRRNIVYLYVGLTLLYALIFGEATINSISAGNWLIAPIMALGSFVAGSTFLGGGAVAFPALTKMLAIEPGSAKLFSLAIQSIGMSSASLYIISRIKALPYSFIALYMAASLCGISISLAFLGNQFNSSDIRLTFTLFLMCFLGVYLYTLNSKNTSDETHLERNSRDILLTLVCGFIGGTLSGLIGSGADLIGFSLLALYFRIDIKRATQISIILMAATSLYGTIFQSIILNGISDDIKAMWYIAAPVVLLGAPLGAYACKRMKPIFLITLICSIVFIEALSSAFLVPINTNRYPYYLLIAMAFIFILFLLRYFAEKKHDKKLKPEN